MRFAAAIIAAALLLSGCEAGMVQRRVVVHALGIDPGEDGGYSVSYQIFTGGSGGDSGPVDASEQTVITLPAEGKTLFDAESSLGLKTGREVFLGDVELIVISDELSGRGLSDPLQYFARAGIYPGVNVIFCEGRARDIIGEKLEQGSATAILLKGVLEKAIEGSRACSSRIIELSNALLFDGGARAVPLISLEKREKPEESSSVSPVDIKIPGSILIGENDPAALTEDEVAGIRLLRCNAEKIDLAINTPSGDISIGVDNISAKRSVKIENGSPAVTVYIAGKYRLESAPDGFSEEEAKRLAERELLRLCGAAAEKSRETGEDFLDVGRLLRKYEPEYFNAQNGGFSGISDKTIFYVKACLRKY